MSRRAFTKPGVYRFQIGSEGVLVVPPWLLPSFPANPHRSVYASILTDVSSSSGVMWYVVQVLLSSLRLQYSPVSLRSSILVVSLLRHRYCDPSVS